MARGWGFTYTDAELKNGIRRLPPSIGAKVQASLEYHAARMETYAKQNAPWTDQTGNARSGLSARAVGGGERGPWAIVIFHQVPYGIWLEVKNSGKYAIILPTLRKSGPEVMKTLNSVISGRI